MDSHRRFLCIAYAFPPINRSGTHRTLGFVRELAALGWQATVITVQPDGEPIDDSLLDHLPADTHIIRTRWVDFVAVAKRMTFAKRERASAPHLSTTPTDGPPVAAPPQPGVRRGVRDWFSRLLITPDTRIGWIRPAARAGLQAIKSLPHDLIFSTSPYMSAHLAALRIANRTGLPWVADFRDPWRGNPFRTIEYASLDRWDAACERRVLRRADKLVCCTPTMTADLQRRVPDVQGKCHTILNGYDRARFSEVTSERITPEDVFTVAHAGQFYGPRSPKTLFLALLRVRSLAPEVARRIRLIQIGSASYDGRSLADWADELGVAEHVHLTGVQSHGRTLSLLAGSDALFLAGSAGYGGHLQVPNKLFEYLALRKPIVAMCVENNPIRTILSSARAIARVCDPDDVAGLADALIEGARGVWPAVADAWSGVELFERAGRAEELAGVFNRLVSRKQPSGGTVIASATGSIGGKTVALGGSAAVSSAKAIHTFE